VQSFPVLAERAPDQLRYALDQSLGFLKSQVLVCFLDPVAPSGFVCLFKMCCVVLCWDGDVLGCCSWIILTV
jgi:hypothetical protein